MGSEDWAGVKDAFRGMKQERHAEWFAKNMEALRASGLRFTEHATSVVFREPGKPAVDFYPHTGRWRLVGRKNGGSKTMSGGAKAFLRWYEKQSVQIAPAPGFEPVQLAGSDELLLKVRERLGPWGSLTIHVTPPAERGPTIRASWTRDYGDCVSDPRPADGPTFSEVLQAVLDHEDRADAAEPSR